jgi:hypothetical protein
MYAVLVLRRLATDKAEIAGFWIFKDINPRQTM